VATKHVIYHNPRCRKSREGLKILRDAGIEPEIVRAIAEYPKLLERPVVVKGKKAILGRPPGKIKDLL